MEHKPQVCPPPTGLVTSSIPAVRLWQFSKTKRTTVRHEFSPSPLMRECCVLPASVCKCLRAPANPSFTMPVLQLLSDPGSVRSQVSCCCCCEVRVHVHAARLPACLPVCLSFCPSACFCLLFQALLHFEGCSFLLPFAKETPNDLTRCCLLDSPKQDCFCTFTLLQPLMCAHSCRNLCTGERKHFSTQKEQIQTCRLAALIQKE